MPVRINAVGKDRGTQRSRIAALLQLASEAFQFFDIGGERKIDAADDETEFCTGSLYSFNELCFHLRFGCGLLYFHEEIADYAFL